MASFLANPTAMLGTATSPIRPVRVVRVISSVSYLQTLRGAKYHLTEQNHATVGQLQAQEFAALLERGYRPFLAARRLVGVVSAM